MLRIRAVVLVVFGIFVLALLPSFRRAPPTTAYGIGYLALMRGTEFTNVPQRRVHLRQRKLGLATLVKSIIPKLIDHRADRLFIDHVPSRQKLLNVLPLRRGRRSFVAHSK